MKTAFTNGLEFILGFLGVFFFDITGALVAVGFLVMADTFTGVWAAFKRKEIISSRRLGGIIPKLILYPLAIIIAKVARDYLSEDIPWVYVTTGIIAAVEVRSNFENIGDILGFNLWNRIKKIIWKDKIDSIEDGEQDRQSK